MILSQIILPARLEDNKKELYFHGDAECFGQLSIKTGSPVMFDTYFNAFFYSPYLKYTRIRSVQFRIVTSGIVRLSLLCLSSDGEEQVLAELGANGERVQTEFLEIFFEHLPEDGAIFLRAEAESQIAVIHEGRFEADIAERDDIHVAAVICTYKREEYVQRNLELMQSNIWDMENCPAKNNMDVFVVDNGKTLRLDNTEHISIFQNKNCGGSGGFTRGLVEAYQRRERYTHVLFMDDDITFEAETLVRTIQFMKAASAFDKPLCIGGQMLIQDKPTIQFESGASYRKGRLVSNNRGLDVSDRMALLKNISEQSVEYNAWWYFCFPISVVDSHGLPLPLFIKTDDIEYSLRMKPQIVLLNGIGVWHMDFKCKYSTHLEYYIKRNELVVSAIHSNGDGIIPSMRKMILSCGKAALKGNPQNVDFILWAYRDFLKGPDFFLSTDGEKLNNSLIHAKMRPAKNRIWSILSDPFRLIPVSLQLIRDYARVRDEYIKRMPELTSTAFWCKQLSLSK